MNKPNHSVKWNTLEEQITFQNKYITLHNDLVETPDKRKINYLKIVTRNFSTILCYTEEGKIVLVRQYRYAFDDFSWECPGGIIEGDEDPTECAMREVLEETGYKVVTIKHALKIHPNAMSSAWGYTFIAKVKKFSHQTLDSNEFILVNEFDPQEVESLVNTSKFAHGPSIVAWMQYKLTKKPVG